MRKYNVTPAEFVKAWQESQTADEAAKKLSMPKPTVLARVSEYRSMGIKLKPMRRAQKDRLNVDELNRLIGELAGEVGLGAPPAPAGARKKKVEVSVADTSDVVKKLLESLKK